MEPSLCSSRVGPTFYRPNVQLLYVHFDALARAYPGWGLTEIKLMPHRERRYWLDLLRWRLDQVTPNV